MLPSIAIKTGLASDGRIAIGFYEPGADEAYAVLMTPRQARRFLASVKEAVETAENLLVTEKELEEVLHG